jgi:hypothetical protein
MFCNEALFDDFVSPRLVRCLCTNRSSAIGSRAAPQRLSFVRFSSRRVKRRPGRASFSRGASGRQSRISLLRKRRGIPTMICPRPHGGETAGGYDSGMARAAWRRLRMGARREGCPVTYG